MKRALVSLILLLGLARANESRELQFKATDCAAFKKSFDELGYQGLWSHRLEARCRIVDKKGAACTITNTGIDQLDEVYLQGYFVFGEDEVLRLVMKDEPFALIIMCKDGHCFDMKFWNTTSLVGFGCYSEKPKHPKKDPPKVPAAKKNGKEISA